MTLVWLNILIEDPVYNMDLNLDELVFAIPGRLIWFQIKSYC